jgi:hypothetical protein
MQNSLAGIRSELQDIRGELRSMNDRFDRMNGRFFWLFGFLGAMWVTFILAVLFATNPCLTSQINKRGTEVIP